MAAIVVPFRGAGGKQRLGPLTDDEREALALAMLEDVLTACRAVGATVVVTSDDDGFSWTPPKWTNIWGYPAELIPLQDGRYLMIYGYRRPPYGVRGIVSDDGLHWDVADEFVVREGGVPLAHVDNPGLYQHIGYPSVTLLGDGSVLAMYHEYTDDDHPIQHIVSTRFRVDS